MSMQNGTTQNKLTSSEDCTSFLNYKASELGLIPSDWECSNFGDIFTFKQGIQVPVESQNRNQSAGWVRFIRIIDLTDPDEPPRFIKSPGEKYILKKEDLFMVRYGTPGLTGSNFEGVIANNLFYLIPKIKVSNSFFFHALAYRREDILELSG
ncbi:MAG: hypothetical protein K2W88_16890, partial [Pararheinheimera sp.]|nr:hypothetical protein [Rheinheimera sp.]